MKKQTLLVLITAFLIAIIAESAVAGPGGSIASSGSSSSSSSRSSNSSYHRTDSDYSDASLPEFVPFLIFIGIPILLILKLSNTQQISTLKKTAKARLNEISEDEKIFEWQNLQPLFEQLMHHTYREWQNLNISALSKYMTQDFLREQNDSYLQEWKQEGFVNICHIIKINSLEPYLIQTEKDFDAKNGIIMTVELDAIVKDYLEFPENGNIIEGTKDDVQAVRYWTFILSQGNWKVAEIANRPGHVKFINQYQKNKH
ncbi:hypothetical protein [Photobacterium galatheae]|uniref:Tim44-like domain-containing protein n=1 Tax=Photobacterium galatheae TaxID=1654360 RepID=A0A066S078_9GAMM|nr:hypothetical protein [Photobacterium galatheae]KDM93342.1 hypothetical protein EA58_01655 [Photobacterium galatheae]MCM0150464.1 hypothetical protein [Photobacterium galatheae]